VGELLKVDDERWWWELILRRNFFQWEEARVNLLVDYLDNVALSHEDDDWEWTLYLEEGFSVKSAYDSLVECGDSPILSDFELKIFSEYLGEPGTLQGSGFLLATSL
jgi:hypothetical protein